jgi:Tfp pilus assembly protein PilX
MSSAAAAHLPSFVKRLARRLRGERGFVLPATIGMATVLGIAGTTAIVYSTSSARTSYLSSDNQNAYALGEAGLNSAMAVLAGPSSNALDPDTLPKCTSNETKYTDASAQRTDQSTWRHDSFPGGTAVWCGTLSRANQVWYLTSIGSTRNQTGPKADKVTRMLQAVVPVSLVLIQPLGNPVWNYLYAGHTGSTCDQTLNNNISGSSRMYVAGNLCLSQNVVLTQDKVVVGGDLNVANNAAVGLLTSRVETYVGGNCVYGTGSWGVCSGVQDLRHIYSKLLDGTIGVSHTPENVPPPTADYTTWYENAMPGPSQSCTTSSGPVPVFDNNYPARDNSVTPTFNLTPLQAYECRVGPADQPSGLIKWTPPTSTTPGTLSLSGTVYIEGSAAVTTGNASSTFAVNYDGQASLYLSGTFLLDGRLCAVIDSTKKACDTSGWNPNGEMLTIVADGNGGQVNPGDSIQLSNNSSIQGAVFATNNVEFGNNATVDGPIVGSQIILSNNLTTNSFSTITTVPAAMPSNDPVFAKVGRPRDFTG